MSDNPKKIVLINASNLHSGGGVQVAVSFLYELTLMPVANFRYAIHVVVSSEVAGGLEALNIDASQFKSYDVINTHGVQAIYSSLNKRINNYDLVFTIFGPNYLRVKSNKEVVGFAQPWMLDFVNPISNKMPMLSRSILRLKFYLQWLFFLRADHYIVELMHVKSGLCKDKRVAEDKISIVHNTVSSLYYNKAQWKEVLVVNNNEDVSLGIVTRDYPHKNLNILPKVAEVLALEHNIIVHFYTTLNNDEWATKSDYFKKYVSTVGSLSPEQCPSFYKQVDGIIFPSLLECFSATPLEAMVMSKPLFSSDRGFVRDVCGDYSIYFDPENPNDIATKISNYFKYKPREIPDISEARSHALNFSNAKNRAENYLKIIEQKLEG